MCLCVQDLRFTPRAGLEQSNERTTKQSEQLDHRATASPDSHRFASYMEFPTGTTRPSPRYHSESLAFRCFPDLRDNICRRFGLGMECLNGNSADRNSCQDRQRDDVMHLHHFLPTDSLTASFYPTSGYSSSTSDFITTIADSDFLYRQPTGPAS
jgi:hypothetical protein